MRDQKTYKNQQNLQGNGSKSKSKEKEENKVVNFLRLSFHFSLVQFYKNFLRLYKKKEKVKVLFFLCLLFVSKA